MSAAADTLSGAALKTRVVEFVRGASMEITPHDARILPQLAELLPPGALVFVAHTPRATLTDVVETAVRAEAAGFRASPHIAARRIESAEALRTAVQTLRAGGVKQALTIAGDNDRVVG